MVGLIGLGIDEVVWALVVYFYVIMIMFFEEDDFI